MADETTTDAAPESAASERSRRRVVRGLVTSDKMDKTVVVTTVTLKQHALYGRTLKRSKAYKAHDENNECGTGDTVEIMECRPLSKEKRWRVVRVVEKAK